MSIGSEVVETDVGSTAELLSELLLDVDFDVTLKVGTDVVSLVALAVQMVEFSLAAPSFRHKHEEEGCVMFVQVA